MPKPTESQDSSPLRCPDCGLYSPSGTLVCDCGHDFRSSAQRMVEELLSAKSWAEVDAISEKYVPKARQRMGGWRFGARRLFGSGEMRGKTAMLMNRIDWWVGVVLIFGALIFHAAVPRYDYANVDVPSLGDAAAINLITGQLMVRIDRWTGDAKFGVVTRFGWTSPPGMVASGQLPETK